MDLDNELGKFRKGMIRLFLPASRRAYYDTLDIRKELEAELGFLKIASPLTYVKHLSRRIMGRKLRTRFMSDKGQSNSFIWLMLPVLIVLSLFAFSVTHDTASDPQRALEQARQGIDEAILSMAGTEKTMRDDILLLESFMVSEDREAATISRIKAIESLEDALDDHKKTLADFEFMIAQRSEALERVYSGSQSSSKMDLAFERYASQHRRLKKNLKEIRQGAAISQPQIVDEQMNDMRASLDDIEKLRKEILQINMEKLS